MCDFMIISVTISAFISIADSEDNEIVVFTQAQQISGASDLAFKTRLLPTYSPTAQWQEGTCFYCLAVMVFVVMKLN